MIRDVFNDPFSAIHIDDETLYLQIKDYVQEIAPGKESIVKFYESKYLCMKNMVLRDKLKQLW